VVEARQIAATKSGDDVTVLHMILLLMPMRIPLSAENLRT
jgi:hypothetical protein